MQILTTNFKLIAIPFLLINPRNATHWPFKRKISTTFEWIARKCGKTNVPLKMNCNNFADYLSSSGQNVNVSNILAYDQISV